VAKTRPKPLSVIASAPPAALPPLYDRWMRQLLGAQVRGEPRATCDDCAMCATPGEETAAGTLFFNPRTKCCTFIPLLPNFLVGRILADDDPHPAAVHGRASVEARVASGQMVLPLGLGRTPAQTAMYHHRPIAFGQSEALRCPHYLEEGGLCGVWRHRDATCATWFCKYERGEVGRIFWLRVFRLLQAAEQALALHCALELGLGPAELHTLLAVMDPTPGGGAPPSRPDGTSAPAVARTIWGRWHGRERELYIEAGRIVDGLSWADVRALAGPLVRAHEGLVRDAHAQREARVLPPGPLRPGDLRGATLDPDRAHLTGYSTLDPVTMPRALFDALARFDGKHTTKEALRLIAAEEGLDVDDAVILRLLDFGVLADAGK
jgi:hypothetical protein